MDSEIIKSDIFEILKDADLSQLSTKKIRLQLEAKYKIDLIDRKSEIDGIVMATISDLEKKKEEEKKKKTKQSSSNGRASKRKHSESSDDRAGDDDDDDEGGKSSNEEKDDKPDKNTEDDEDIARQLQEEEENGAVRRTRHAHKKKATKTEKKPRKKGVPRENRFTETCNLSPELAAIMGEDKMRRSDVVKKMWAIVKEKNLFDPKNKRYMICDEQMLTVFGKKKILLFGMMKYLTSHIYKSDEVIDSS